MATLEQFEALASRLVACKHWRWMPGMLRHASGPHPSGPTGPRVERWDDGADFVAGWSDTDWLPDLTDPATLGCLLALVREAWEDPLICTSPDNTGCAWWLDGWGADSRVPSKLHGTEVEALVAALEAA